MAALRVIFSKNPIESSLFLILCFCSSSVIWLLLGAEFLSMLLVMVYVGAVMVLFLFIVMMLNLRYKPNLINQRRYKIIGSIVGIFIFLEIQALLLFFLRKPMLSNFLLNKSTALISKNSGNNTLKIGKLLFTEYIFAFEIVGSLLLLAILAAVSLAMTKSSGSAKRINPTKQIQVKSLERIRLLNIASE